MNRLKALVIFIGSCLNITVSAVQADNIAKFVFLVVLYAAGFTFIYLVLHYLKEASYKSAAKTIVSNPQMASTIRNWLKHLAEEEKKKG